MISLFPSISLSLSLCLSVSVSLSQQRAAFQKDIVLGQTVISKHKNLRYYSSKVTQVTSQTFYEVMFDDGSFSNDTYPEDIVVRRDRQTDTHTHTHTHTHRHTHTHTHTDPQKEPEKD